MAQLIIQFDSYQINYYSGDTTHMSDVSIGCRSGKNNVGSINFIRDNKQIPKNMKSKDGKAVILYFPLSSFNDIINILRYEKPVYLVLHDSGLGCIITGIEEPVGEQEHMPKPTT